jgi:hypothetical protein
MPKRANSFPLAGMQYSDRLKLTIKEYGRKVVIKVNRATALVVSKDQRTITISYDDGKTRKIR